MNTVNMRKTQIWEIQCTTVFATCVSCRTQAAELRVAVRPNTIHWHIMYSMDQPYPEPQAWLGKGKIWLKGLAPPVEWRGARVEKGLL